MHRHFTLFLAVLGTPLLSAASPLMETWESGYSGNDATGPHVIGYWKFDGNSPQDALRDLSGKGHELTLEGGGLLNPKGKSGGAFESFPGFPVQDTRHAVVTPHRPDLSPAGAFTLEMWIAPKAEFADNLRCFLLDKKYVDHTDYQWQIGEADKGGRRRMWITLGFGSESRVFYAEAARFETGVWHHLAFTYDGAGEGRFFIDGQTSGSQHHEGVSTPVPGTKSLSIGDRLGSNYGGFPGLIDEVRLCKGVLAFEPVALTINSPRRVWERMETAKAIVVNCTNLRKTPLVNASLRLSLSDGGDTVTVALPSLASGEAHLATFPVNTGLRPGDYLFRARLELSEPKAFATDRETTFTIVGRRTERMPVIMWGAGGEEIPRLKEIGFTHFAGMSAPADAMWKDKKVLPPGDEAYLERNRRTLDDALKNGLEVFASLSPMNALTSDPANLRIGRDGKPYPREDICAAIPAFAPFFRNVGKSITAAYGDHPAFTMALVNTEVRDSSTPSFNPIDVENYRAFSGGEIPAEVAYRGGVDWLKLKDFPANRVIADDHPILKYYRWFWTVGDGWNGLHSALNEGLKENARPDFRTFFDPAVRQPSVSGAGGNVDILSHWTYTYPDPLKIGLCTDQLFAMAEASGKRQEIMKMTQLIWYRSQTAPIPVAGATGTATPVTPVAWQDHDPEAAYITIAPMHLRQALWSKLARPIRGIMYHGWQSLVATDSPGAYRYTNPHTQYELKRLIHEIVEPLGPALLHIPGSRSEVAFLESFTSQIFARRGGYGSNLGWSADLWLALQHAYVPADVIFEETLLKNGLEDRRFLILSECDVLTESLVKVIADWQGRGGKVIADKYLCPGLKADLVLPEFTRTKKAVADKAQVIALAATIGPAMEKLGFVRKFACDNPEIVLRTRSSGDALYLFAINDKREFGTYVGQHGLVMENGIASSGMIRMSNGATPHVYDLVDGVEVALSNNTLPVRLAPCDGRLFLLLPKALGGVTIEAPVTAKTGDTITVSIRVHDEAGNPLKAVIPALLEIRDANARLAEGSGHCAIVDGSLTVKLNLAPNEDPGAWQISVKELASRRSATASIQVTTL